MIFKINFLIVSIGTPLVLLKIFGVIDGNSPCPAMKKVWGDIR
jgi:hypothetical protein